MIKLRALYSKEIAGGKENKAMASVTQEPQVSAQAVKRDSLSGDWVR